MARKSIIKCPLDFVSVPPLEKNFQNIHAKFDVLHHTIISYAVQPEALQRFIHDRYTCETFTDVDGADKALLSVVISQSTPARLNRLEKFIDPPPYTSVSYRCLVMDKVFWYRSSWNFAAFMKSLFYSKFSRKVYGLPLFHAQVDLNQRFDMDLMRYTQFDVASDGENGVGKLNISIEDTGTPLLEAPPYVGFDTNESMLAALALPCETVTRGEGNCLYRQGAQCTPFSPSVGHLKQCTAMSYITDTLGIPDMEATKPHSVLLQYRVEDMQTLEVETFVEDENDPHNASQNTGMSARIQRKAMNRAFAFRDHLRDKYYAGEEARGNGADTKP